MQRRNFIKSLALPAIILPAFNLLGNTFVEENKRAFVVRSLKSRFNASPLFRDRIPNDLKISTKDTNGNFCLFDYVGITRIPGPTLHMHTEQDELFYIHDGEFIFQTGDDRFIATKGDAVFGPRNVQHTWTQLSEKGRLQYFALPAGKLEAFFDEQARLKGRKMTTEETQLFENQYGIKRLGPSLQFDALPTATAVRNGYVIKAGQCRNNVHVSEKTKSPVHLKLGAKDSNGMLSVFDYTGSGKGGPPLHVHPDQDEAFFVLEGQYTFLVGDDKHQLQPGDTIFLPRGVPHTWAQQSEKGKLLFFFHPSGQMEKFFEHYSQQNSVPPPDVMTKVFSEHGMKIVGPPIGLD